MNERVDGISRREFLNRVALLASLAAGYPAAVIAWNRSRSEQIQLPAWCNEDPWRTIADVQQHLFPAADDAPGADDIQAVVYLRNAIENPAADGEDKKFVFNGAGWLNDLSQKQTQQHFTLLEERQKEKLLREIEQSQAGRNWLSLLLTYLLEALLADPVYGGNPDGVGWDWLEHRPGFPAPSADKAWYKLAASVRYQRKA